MATFATRLKELRLSNGYSQKQLAEQIEVTAQSVSLWERGPRKPDNKTIGLLCFALNCTKEYLLGLTDEYEPPMKDPTQEDLDWLACAEDDEVLTGMATQMCQLSAEMREMVKAVIKQAYRLDKMNDRLIPIEDHVVRITSSVLLRKDAKDDEAHNSSQ